MKKDIIAKRSYHALITLVVSLLVLWGAFFILMFLGEKNKSTLLTFLIITIIFMPLFVYDLIRPRTIIIRNQHQLLIYPNTKKEVSIRLNDIISISSYDPEDDYQTFSILITTINNKHIIKNISNRKKVIGTIHSIIKKYRDIDSYLNQK